MSTPWNKFSTVLTLGFHYICPHHEINSILPNQKFIEGQTLWIVGIHRSPDDHHWRPSSAFHLFPIIYNSGIKCHFPDIGLLLDMPMISGTESLEFPVQIIDREEWSELPIGAATATRIKSGTSVIRRSSVPPRVWQKPMHVVEHLTYWWLMFLT